MTKPMTFRIWALAALAVLALGACNRDWDTGRTARAGADSAVTANPARTQDAMGMAPGASTQRPPGLQVGAAGARAAFADLPDRGNLVGYPQEPVVRREGAYTWHRADVSEEHALRAIVNGELRITAPDGQLLAFEYERHVEHPTGDWTWIGRLRDAPPGRQAILTFGARAVFGSIAQTVAEPLRLTMREGASWLMETDPALLAGVESRVLRPESPDFLLPPFHFGNPAAIKASGGAETMSSSEGSVESSSSTTGTTTTVVDVLVGYTSGFATYHGGDSQARTRINFIVDLANQGYIESQIDARVRLVHALQVSYPDATDNGDTLEKMTGYKSGTGKTTPDPAFSALRNARETYGADLVTLVRKFNTPENDGCGIAWLIGGGLSTITQGYEYFGYSVVSDGTDQGEDGKNYFCREETMVHEFGHNMGSAHDVETAKGDDGVLDNPDDYGSYIYSFGYRTGPGSGDFYTIMAYREKRDSGTQQRPYRVFSNPELTEYCGGFPCGTNSADNARSLRQTIPVIAGFRATVVADPDPVARIVRDDFNGDGRSDLAWRHASTGSTTIWLSADVSTSIWPTQITSMDWKIVGIGDFDRDGEADLLWRNATTGANVLWPSAQYSRQIRLRTVSDLNWRVEGIGDFNDDGKSDILWRHATTGSNVIWYSGNYSTQAKLTRITNLDWRIVGVGDINGDGRSDIVWRNASTGANVAWLSGLYDLQQTLARVSNLNWRVVGVADFDGDGEDDLLWRNFSSGANVIWPSGDYSRQRTLSTVSNLYWRVEAVGDYDGDGKDDIAWRNWSSGENVIWPAANRTDQKSLYTVSNLKWEIVP